MVHYRIYFLFWLLILHFDIHARDLAGSIGLIKGINNESETPFYVKVAMAINEEYDQGELTTKQRPFSRSVREVSRGTSDFHFPLICPKHIERTDNFDFLTEKVGAVAMALYSSKENPITAEDLKYAKYTLTPSSFFAEQDVFSTEELVKLKKLDQTYSSQSEILDAVSDALGRKLLKREKQITLLLAFPYKIETDRLHVELFDIPTSPAPSTESGLRQVVRKRIDGYIFGAVGVETVINKIPITSEFERSFYDWFDVCVVIGPNLRGSQLDQDLSLAIKKFKKSDKYNELFGKFIELNKTWLKKYSN